MYNTVYSNSFTVVINPCPSTVIDAYALRNMKISVHGSADIEALSSIPQDSVSKLNGDLTGETFCGAKSMTIKSVSPSAPVYSGFLSFDTSSTPTLTAITNDPSHQGVYTVTIEIVLDDYPTIKSTETFTLTIESCQVSSMVKTPVVSQKYNVYTPKIDFTWTYFDISPCTYALDYSYSLRDTSTGTTVAIPGPSMLTQTNSDRTFEVLSNLITDVGTYEIIVTGTTPAGTMSPAYSEDLMIPLEVANECATDIVTPTSTISDQTFTIQLDSAKTENPTWSSTVSSCPVTYEIRRVVAGVDQNLTGFETAALTFDSTSGQLQIFTND